MRPTTPTMKGSPFRFRLERIRELRERKEDEAKLALAGAISEHFRAEEDLRAAEQRIEGARAAQLDAGAYGRSGTDLVAYQAYLERTETARQASLHHLDRRELDVADRRDELSEAARDRQAL